MKRALFSLLVLSFTASGHAQLVDQSCVRAMQRELAGKVNRLAAQLPPDQAGRLRTRYQQFEQRQQQLILDARRAEAEYREAWQSEKNALQSRNPQLRPDSDEFKEKLYLTLMKSPDFDQANARIIHTQIHGFNPVEGKQMELAKEIPPPKAEYDAQVRRLATSLSTQFQPKERAQLTGNFALVQLAIVSAASQRAAAGKTIEDWMIAIPPTSASTAMEEQKSTTSLGFDTAGILDSANELRQALIKIKAKQDQTSLDLTHLPRFVPPPVVRQTWANVGSKQTASGELMPATQKEASAAGSHIVRAVEHINKAQNLFKETPPPIAPGKTLKKWAFDEKSYVENAKETLKRTVYILED
jgi:hypothetical protein